MTEPLLQITGLQKRFAGVHALDDVNFSVERGEVHALLGENGAGKSTLLKVLAGAVKADDGEIRLAGRLLDRADSPGSRQSLGIVTIYQEFNLVPFMTVAENMFLGREPRKNGLLDWRRMNADAAQVLKRLGLDLPPTTLVAGLSVAAQQMIEIARALTLEARLIVMDEPTAALSDAEVQILHHVVRDLRAAGISVIYVTHRLAEVIMVCDGYTVLRDGRQVATGRVASADIATFVSAMVGRDLQPAQRSSASPGPWALRLEGVVQRPGRPDGSQATISFGVREGEIIGLAGLVGAGRTEVMRLVFGADPATSGVVWLGADKTGLFRSPAQALRSGMAMVPEDRKPQGCFLSHSVRWNLSLPSLEHLARHGVLVDETAEAALVADYMQRLRIRAPSDAARIGDLSGGNQQKVLLARCMALKPKILVVDEPTRGVDIGAKGEVHQILFDLAQAGVAVIVISSDMPELLELSDRIVVLHEGGSVGELDRAQADEVRLMTMMSGQAEMRVQP